MMMAACYFHITHGGVIHVVEGRKCREKMAQKEVQIRFSLNETVSSSKRSAIVEECQSSKGSIISEQENKQVPNRALAGHVL